MPQTTTLGGNAKDIVVGKIAHGLMMMTWRAEDTPDDQAFEAIRAGVDSLPKGAKMILNSGEFYGRNLSLANLELLARFFKKYPDYAGRTFLSVKGGTKLQSFEIDASPDNLRRSVDLINAALSGTKKLDLFECARVDPKIPIEDSIRTLAGLIKEGKFDHIGLSECSAETLRRANAVHPIAAVEIEISPLSYEDETRKVIATAKELNVAVLGYSPVGRGFLTGQIQKAEDLDPNDLRHRFSRFKDENIKHNLTLVDAWAAVAKRKNVSPAQLSIAWVSSLGNHVIPLPGSSKSTRTLENIAASDIQLTVEEQDELGKILGTHSVKGDRYYGLSDRQMLLWG